MKFKTLLLACPLAFLLASCGNKTNTVDLKFSVDPIDFVEHEICVSGKLKWTPNVALDFGEDRKFEYADKELAGHLISFSSDESGLATFMLGFQPTTDVTGTLSFSYEITSGTGVGQIGKSSVSVVINKIS